MQGLSLLLITLVAFLSRSGAFVVPEVRVAHDAVKAPSRVVLLDTKKEDDIVDVEIVSKEPDSTKTISDTTDVATKTDSAKVEKLVDEDEWVAFAMRMSERVREGTKASVEKISKSQATKKAGELLKEADTRSRDIDARVKKEVARLRGKENYELGDLVKAMDKIAKDKVCEITGKEEYELGDIKNEVNKRVTAEAAAICGKEDFDMQDLKVAINDKVSKRVSGFKEKGMKKISDIKQVISQDREEWAKKKFGEDRVDKAKAKIARVKEEGSKKYKDAKEKVRGKIGEFMKKSSNKRS